MTEKELIEKLIAGIRCVRDVMDYNYVNFLDEAFFVAEKAIQEYEKERE
jgi:hypothetical protein